MEGEGLTVVTVKGLREGDEGGDEEGGDLHLGGREAGGDGGTACVAV